MFSLKTVLSSLGMTGGGAKKVFSLTNDHPRELLVSLEPVPEDYMLEPKGTVDVILTKEGNEVALIVGRLADDTPYITIWPDNGDVRIERNGKDVFSYE